MRGCSASSTQAIGSARVSIQKRYAKNLQVSFTPDVVIDDGPWVADIKYKVRGPDWHRPDLYQVLAFAEAFGAERGAIFAFAAGTSSAAMPPEVGNRVVSPVDWPAHPDIGASMAAGTFMDPVQGWVEATSSVAKSA